MAYTYSLLASSTVGAGGTSAITFNNIPQNYTDLVLKLSTRQSGASSATTIRMGFNGSTVAIYNYRHIQGDGGSASSSSGTGATNTSNETVVNDGAGATANTFASGEVYIPNYTSANAKSWSADSVQENNASVAYSRLTAGLWNNLTAINRISLVDSEGNFVQYSTAYLYGIRVEL
jgi:hypothetical protein